MAFSAAYLSLKCDEMVVLLKRGVYIFPGFKDDKGYTHPVLQITVYLDQLEKFSLLCFFAALNLSEENLNRVSSVLLIECNASQYNLIFMFRAVISKFLWIDKMQDIVRKNW